MTNKAIKVFTTTTSEWPEFQNTLNEFEKSYCKATNFSGQNKKIVHIPNSCGDLEKVILGMGDKFNSQNYGLLARNLNDGEYEFVCQNQDDEFDAVLHFNLGAYFYDEFKTSSRPKIQLVAPKNQKAQKIANIINQGRDLVNSPANIMGPDKLSKFVKDSVEAHNLIIEEIVGDDLLSQNYPLIHAVGRSSGQEPRLLILRRPMAGAPKIGIIGKGVVFDTGGLNLKTGNFMGLMKKDMGGAACAISLLQLLLEDKSILDLNLYLPIVENSVSSNSMRPGDIVKSRKGLSVEIDNTDAEGRLILSDALTRASEDEMDLMVDFATLTGAARVALGPELPPFYSNSNQLIAEIQNCAQKVNDPVWNMPLWENYSDDLESQVADLKNGGGAFAGSMTAALFLQKFVNCKEWVHFDVYCWNPKEKPNAPMGGEIQAVRTMAEVLKSRFK